MSAHTINSSMGDNNKEERHSEELTGVVHVIIAVTSRRSTVSESKWSIVGGQTTSAGKHNLIPYLNPSDR